MNWMDVEDKMAESPGLFLVVLASVGLGVMALVLALFWAEDKVMNG